MPIEYFVSENGKLVETFPKGILNTELTIDYFKKISVDQKIKNRAIEVVYFKDVSDFDISYEECLTITKEYQFPKQQINIKTTIFVCETDLEVGMANMLKTLHNISTSHQVIIVKSKEELDSTIQKLTNSS